jgi:hypothetical protein
MTKLVNEFKKGDNIVLYGWRGKVVDVDHIISQRSGRPCTYLQVEFEEPQKVGYQYEGGWYGGADNIVAYGAY